MDTIEDNKDKVFKGQQKNEEFECYFVHHWIALVKDFLYFGIFLIIVACAIAGIDTIQGVVSGDRGIKLLFFVGFLTATIFFHRFFLRLLNYFVNTGIITSLRVIDHKKSLYFVDNMDSIDMAQIQNVEKISEGILPNLLNYGDIKVFLTASDATKTFYGVPNAKHIFRRINRAREERQRVLRGARKIETIQRETPYINLDLIGPKKIPEETA